MPAVGVGLRLKAQRFAEVIPSRSAALLAALESDRPIALDGGTVWDALSAVDLDEADQFRRACGWRPGAPAGWLLIDRTRWTYDPPTGLLSPDYLETT